MPDYDGQLFSPPAPVARVILRAPGGAKSIADVVMQIDSGADVTLIPATCADRLALHRVVEKGFVLQGFDGYSAPANAVDAEMFFLGRFFRGQFLIIDQDYGILGRNVLNHVSLLLDGPQLTWREAVH